MKTHFKVKLTGPYAGKTGVLFGRFPFVDGVSVNKLHFIEAQLLATEARGLVMLDDDGAELGPVVPGAMPMAISDTTPVVTLRKAEDAVGKIDVVKEDNGEITHSVVETAAIPDRAGLEKIADKKGIAGLREIAETLGVRGKSIPELINKILEKRG